MSRKLELKKQTMEVWLNYWLGAYVEPQSLTGTYYQYKSIAEVHIIPAPGSIRLCDLNCAAFKRFFGSFSDKAVSSATLKSIYSVARLAMSAAYGAGLVDEIMVDKVDISSISVGKTRILDCSELSKLFEAVSESDNPVAYGLMIIFYTGARNKELINMKWSDFDENEETVKIGNRVVPIPQDEFKDIMKYKERQRAAMADVGLVQRGNTEVLLSKKFKKYSPRNMYNIVEKISAACGIPDLTMTVVRNTFGARWLQAGIDYTQIAYLMGDKRVAITMERYKSLSNELM
ncbi:MAG: site-specific integrase [Prevotella sp.]|nr:site-specific integrase [Prevotella sp.]